MSEIKTNKEANQPAFPIKYDAKTIESSLGLTKREYFAAMAMQGVLASGGTETNSSPKDNTPQWLSSVEKLPPQPKKLFTTEDGVDVFENDCYHAVQKNTFHSLSCNHPLDKPDQWVTFSTKEAAEKYIAKNKPQPQQR